MICRVYFIKNERHYFFHAFKLNEYLSQSKLKQKIEDLLSEDVEIYTKLDGVIPYTLKTKEIESYLIDFIQK